jgi:beta-hydroxylase
MWHDSGAPLAAGAAGVADYGIVPGAPSPDAPMRADPGRPWLIKYGKHLRGAFDRLVAVSSLIPNDPVLDVRDFAWTATLRDNWEAIREEAIAAALESRPAPSLASISPDHRAIAPVDKWRSFFLWGYGYCSEENLERCPRTSALVEQIPGLVSAFFSILAPGTHIPRHRGVTKGLITCHLGLIVPRDGDVRMRVGDRVVRWAEGETLVFDDTYDHEVWNDTDSTRVVLLIQFRRPLRQPGRWFVDKFLEIIRRSAFVQEARANVERWNAAMKALDA